MNFRLIRKTFDIYNNASYKRFLEDEQHTILNLTMLDENDVVDWLEFKYIMFPSMQQEGFTDKEIAAHKEFMELCEEKFKELSPQSLKLANKLAIRRSIQSTNGSDREKFKNYEDLFAFITPFLTPEDLNNYIMIIIVYDTMYKNTFLLSALDSFEQKISQMQEPKQKIQSIIKYFEMLNDIPNYYNPATAAMRANIRALTKTKQETLARSISNESILAYLQTADEDEINKLLKFASKISSMRDDAFALHNSIVKELLSGEHKLSAAIVLALYEHENKHENNEEYLWRKAYATLDQQTQRDVIVQIKDNELELELFREYAASYLTLEPDEVLYWSAFCAGRAVLKEGISPEYCTVLSNLITDSHIKTSAFIDQLFTVEIDEKDNLSRNMTVIDFLILSFEKKLPDVKGLEEALTKFLRELRDVNMPKIIELLDLTVERGLYKCSNYIMQLAKIDLSADNNKILEDALNNDNENIIQLCMRSELVRPKLSVQQIYDIISQKPWCDSAFDLKPQITQALFGNGDLNNLNLAHADLTDGLTMLLVIAAQQANYKYAQSTTHPYMRAENAESSMMSTVEASRQSMEIRKYITRKNITVPSLQDAKKVIRSLLIEAILIYKVDSTMTYEQIAQLQELQKFLTKPIREKDELDDQFKERERQHEEKMTRLISGKLSDNDKKMFEGHDSSQIVWRYLATLDQEYQLIADEQRPEDINNLESLAVHTQSGDARDRAKSLRGQILDNLMRYAVAILQSSQKNDNDKDKDVYDLMSINLLQQLSMIAHKGENAHTTEEILSCDWGAFGRLLEVLKSHPDLRVQQNQHDAVKHYCNIEIINIVALQCESIMANKDLTPEQKLANMIAIRDAITLLSADQTAGRIVGATITYETEFQPAQGQVMMVEQEVDFDAKQLALRNKLMTSYYANTTEFSAAIVKRLEEANKDFVELSAEDKAYIDLCYYAVMENDQSRVGVFEVFSRYAAKIEKQIEQNKAAQMHESPKTSDTSPLGQITWTMRMLQLLNPETPVYNMLSEKLKANLVVWVKSRAKDQKFAGDGDALNTMATKIVDELWVNRQGLPTEEMALKEMIDLKIQAQLQIRKPTTSLKQ